MKTILLTGCAGFIGSHLAERLLAGGYRVIGVDSFDSFYSEAVKRRNLETSLAYPAFTFIQGDIRSSETYRQVATPVDAVIHLAAKAGVRPSIEAPEEYVDVNIHGTQALLTWMKAQGIRKMVFASSSSVYGENEKIPFAESDDVNNPISPYAFTKKAGELLLYTYHSLYRIDAVCLRFFTVFGPRQRPDLAIHKFTRQIFEGRPITLYGDGSTYRDYTYIDDIVDGIVRSLDYVAGRDGVYEILNLGNNAPVALRDMIALLAEAAGREAQISYLERQPGDVERTYADIDKAGAMIGYKPVTGFAEGIARFVAWYRVENALAAGVDG